MEITKTIDRDSATFKLAGWLDTQTAPEFGAALDELPEEVVNLTVDCKDLEYISSAGVRQIVATHKKMESLTLENVSAEIMEVFKLTGIDKRLNIV